MIQVCHRDQSVETRMAEDGDLFAEDLEALLELLTAVLGHTAAGRKGERADHVRALARKCMTVLVGGVA